MFILADTLHDFNLRTPVRLQAQRLSLRACIASRRVSLSTSLFLPLSITVVSTAPLSCSPIDPGLYLRLDVSHDICLIDSTQTGQTDTTGVAEADTTIFSFYKRLFLFSALFHGGPFELKSFPAALPRHTAAWACSSNDWLQLNYISLVTTRHYFSAAVTVRQSAYCSPWPEVVHALQWQTNVCHQQGFCNGSGSLDGWHLYACQSAFTVSIIILIVNNISIWSMYCYVQQSRAGVPRFGPGGPVSCLASNVQAGVLRQVGSKLCRKPALQE